MLQTHAGCGWTALLNGSHSQQHTAVVFDAHHIMIEVGWSHMDGHVGWMELLQMYGEWLHALHAVLAIARQIISRRHIRARTCETLQDSLVFAQDDLWRHRTHWSTLARQPWQSSLMLVFIEQRVAQLFHFLLLVRGRTPGAALPADVWNHILLEAVPCVERFGIGQDGILWVRLRPCSAPLPTAAELAMLSQNPTLLLATDRERLHHLACDAGAAMDRGPWKDSRGGEHQSNGGSAPRLHGESHVAAADAAHAPSLHASSRGVVLRVNSGGTVALQLSVSALSVS